MSHRGHPDCVYTTKSACDKAFRERLGKCVEPTKADRNEPTACRNWATSEVEGRPICSMHAGTIMEAARKAVAAASRAERLNVRIDAALAWHATHPSVWDAPPA